MVFKEDRGGATSGQAYALYASTKTRAPLAMVFGSKEARAFGLRLRSDRWNPLEFIDLCEAHRGAGTEQEMLLRRVQRREWELLFDWCYTHAVEAG